MVSGMVSQMGLLQEVESKSYARNARLHSHHAGRMRHDPWGPATTNCNSAAGDDTTGEGGILYIRKAEL